MNDPRRGDVWLVDLIPTRGREQAGRRPALVVSVDLFNSGPADLVVVLPITSRERRIPFHVGIRLPEGGLRMPSWVKCEDVRSVSRERLVEHLGVISADSLAGVEDRLRILLGL
jgi:mRNA interferase MazF